MLDSDKALFIKILPSERRDDFLDGNLFMNTDKFFSNFDTKDIVRSDTDEDVDESLQVKEFLIQDKNTGQFVPIGGVINPVLHRYGNKDSINIFCVLALLDRSDFIFDEKNLEFGDVAIVIRDAIEFTRRIHDASGKIGRNVIQEPVTYVDKKSYHGQMGPFRKFDSFKYQSEFRYVLTSGRGMPLTLSIGDIRDICYAIPSIDIPKLLPKKK